MSETRASLERLGRFGITPNRELGQNFLVDDNMLDVIGRLAQLDAADSVLEIGGGLGILSAYLANRVANLQVVEVDARLQPLLEEAMTDAKNSRLMIADVMDLDLTQLTPPPTKVVANLPYGVAVPAIIKTIEELGQAELWCVMVQREVADRLAASAGSKIYGIPSVIVQLSCEVKVARSVSRNVFRPVPNVDSALVVLRRRAEAPSAQLRQLVHDAFAHRRKTLVRSLQLCGASGNVLDALPVALESLGHPANERAERLAPQEFAALAEKLPS